MENPIRIVLVVDIRNWAFDRIAQNIQGKLSDGFDIDIVYWDDFSSPNKFVSHVVGLNPKAVHFFFREQISLILETADKTSADFRRFCSRSITTHIPDYLFSDELSLLKRMTLFQFVDGYFTTNIDLHDIYSSSALVPAPWGVIHDWVDLTPNERSSRLTDDKIKVIWSGNSLWGEYAGYVDYKGLETIIRPAMDAVQRKHQNIDFICLDSAKAKTPHSKVLKLMSQSDILLIASEKEGTPLTLIEAMAHKCAVISTPVGITSEILPLPQHEFIYERSSSALFDKLDTLLSDRSLIAELGELNFIAWQEHFGDTSPILDKWSNFFADALSRFKKEGQDRKLSLVPARSKIVRRYVVSAVRASGRMANRLGLVRVLNNISPKFGATYHRLVHGNSERVKVDYSLLDQIYADRLARLTRTEPVVVNAPMWKGVAASTEAIFPQYSIQYPFTDQEYPEISDHAYLEKMSERLANCASEVIIYSGGSKIHQVLARKIKVRNPEKRQYFMWHGSPAQWVDYGQLQFFQSWRNEYDQGIISGVITLKSGLENTLTGMGIKAWYIYNPVPYIDDAKSAKTIKSDNVKVGLFSAISSWYKNPFPQLLSISAKKRVILTTNLAGTDVASALPKLSTVNYVHHMARQDFLNILKEQDINLYVTNTECSPMIALESWACLVPCIVGPAGDIYSSVDRELAEWLVEDRVDDANAISIRIDKVLDNYDRIVDLMKITRSAQRELFVEARGKLLREL